LADEEKDGEHYAAALLTGWRPADRETIGGRIAQGERPAVPLIARAR
jgi:hypothetical protein